MKEKAVVRADALSYADTVKSLISLGLRANTPTICLACTRLNFMGTECGVGGDMRGQVFRKWQWESGPETPLVEICDQFDSV